jgi:hypothetical protein
MTAGDESVVWLLLNAVYHRVLARSPSPEAAKIAISEARRNGGLRMRASQHEHEAQPGLRLAPGEQPPQIPPLITPDFPIYPTDHFQHWDWERSCASRRDPKTRSLFWYHHIEVRQDDVLEMEASPQPKAATEPPKVLKRPQKRPKDVTPRVWLAVLAIDEVERVEHICSTDVDQGDLLTRAQKRMPERSPGKRVPLGLRTLQAAQAYRREHGKPS